MAQETEELETDVAELLCHLAGSVSRCILYENHDLEPTETEKQQFRDALDALIDQRARAMFRRMKYPPGGGPR